MKQKMMTVNAFALSATLLCFAGCGSRSDSRIPPRDSVSGVVTLDGKPIASGSITFFSAEDARQGIQASTSIVDGRYELLVTPGKKQVKISQVEETKPNVFEDLIPAKYNSKTTLEADVSGENKEFDFPLTTN